MESASEQRDFGITCMGKIKANIIIVESILTLFLF